MTLNIPVFEGNNQNSNMFGLPSDKASCRLK